MSPNTKIGLVLLGGISLILSGIWFLSPPKNSPSLSLPPEHLSLSEEEGKISHRIIQGPPQFHPSVPAEEHLQREGNPVILEQ